MKHYIIPIFIPHYGCKHQCIFCNQRRITGRETPVTAVEVQQIIEQHLSQLTQPRIIEVAFYGGSFTALPFSVQQELLTPAYNALVRGRIKGIRLSTRPDCINSEIIALLKRYGVATVELGAQSLDDCVLTSAARGHSAQAVSNAAALIKKAGFILGLQLMLGLPGEDWLSIINTARQVVAIKPDLVRIYPTLVIVNTPLAALYQHHEYTPLTLTQAVGRAAALKLLFERHDINVIRTGLQASADLDDPAVVLAGPYHPSFGEMVESYIFYLMVAHLFNQLPQPLRDVVIHYHPVDHSKLRGIRNQNLSRWQQEYNPAAIELVPDGQSRGQLTLEHEKVSYVTNRDMLFYI